MAPKPKTTASKPTKTAGGPTQNVDDDDSPSQSAAVIQPRAPRPNYRKNAGMRAPNKTANEKASEAAEKERRQKEEESRMDKARTALDAFEKGSNASTANVVSQSVPAKAGQVKAARPLAAKKIVSASSNVNRGVSLAKDTAPVTKVCILPLATLTDLVLIVFNQQDAISAEIADSQLTTLKGKNLKVSSPLAHGCSSPYLALTHDL